jgi:hypothetical protein
MSSRSGPAAVLSDSTHIGVVSTLTLQRHAGARHDDMAVSGLSQLHLPKGASSPNASLQPIHENRSFPGLVLLGVSHGKHDGPLLAPPPLLNLSLGLAGLCTGRLRLIDLHGSCKENQTMC